VRQRFFDIASEPGTSRVLRRPVAETVGPEMTRDEAYSSCPADSYVELYGHQWLVVPFAPVEQPRFFVCTPGRRSETH
jgi:hypothetical protein